MVINNPNQCQQQLSNVTSGDDNNGLDDNFCIYYAKYTSAWGNYYYQVYQHIKL